METILISVEGYFRRIEGKIKGEETTCDRKIFREHSRLIPSIVTKKKVKVDEGKLTTTHRIHTYLRYRRATLR